MASGNERLGPIVERDAGSGPVGGVRVANCGRADFVLDRAHGAYRRRVMGSRSSATTSRRSGSRSRNDVLGCAGRPEPRLRCAACTAATGKRTKRSRCDWSNGGGEAGGCGAGAVLDDADGLRGGPGGRGVRADSWEEPGSVGVNGQYDAQYKSATWQMPGVTGCNLLAVRPRSRSEPGHVARRIEPVGLGVNLKVPQPRDAGSRTRRRSCATRS